MNNYFIILAAGKGHRFSLKKPKQYIDYKGKLLIHHSIDRAIKSKLFQKIVVVISKKYKKEFNKYKGSKFIFINGGKERKDSSLNALKKIRRYKTTNIKRSR